MISFIGSILHGLDKNGPLYKVSAEGIAFEFEGDKLYSRLKLDEVEAIIAPDKIEAIGTKAVEELIEQTRHKLASLLGRYVDKIEAATIVAHLLDKETGKLAPMVVRRTSASGKDSFYIGDDLADPANRSRLYLNREQEMLFSVIGEAMYDSVKSTITKDSFLLSRVEYPLVIIYQAFDPKDSRLYVYL
jgi:phage-related protein